MEKSFKVFFPLFVASTVGISVLIVISGYIGKLSEFFTVAFGFLIAFVIWLIFDGPIEKIGRRTTKAKDEELKEEDSILLQAVPFSSAIIFYLINIMIPDDSVIKIVFSAMIVVFGVAFYAFRAWAKLKDSPKHRYWSMMVLSLVIGSFVGSLIVAAFWHFIFIDTSFPFLLGASAVGNSVVNIFMDLGEKVFKKRYGC